MKRVFFHFCEKCTFLHFPNFRVFYSNFRFFQFCEKCTFLHSFFLFQPGPIFISIKFWKMQKCTFFTKLKKKFKAKFKTKFWKNTNVHFSQSWKFWWQGGEGLGGGESVYFSFLPNILFRSKTQDEWFLYLEYLHVGRKFVKPRWQCNRVGVMVEICIITSYRYAQSSL